MQCLQSITGQLLPLLGPLAVALMWCNSARGDGGALRLSQRSGDRRVSVFTAPTPLRAGKVDVSVFLQDAETSRPVTDAELFVMARPLGRRGGNIRKRATPAEASNKLFQAAEFELPEAGRWQFTIELADPTPASLRFETDVSEPPPQWQTLAPWIGWPWLVAAIFCMNRVLKHRRRS